MNWELLDKIQDILTIPFMILGTLIIIKIYLKLKKLESYFI